MFYEIIIIYAFITDTKSPSKQDTSQPKKDEDVKDVCDTTELKKDEDVRDTTELKKIKDNKDVPDTTEVKKVEIVKDVLDEGDCDMISVKTRDVDDDEHLLGLPTLENPTRDHSSSNEDPLPIVLTQLKDIAPKSPSRHMVQEDALDDKNVDKLEKARIDSIKDLQADRQLQKRRVGKFLSVYDNDEKKDQSWRK